MAHNLRGEARMTSLFTPRGTNSVGSCIRKTAALAARKTPRPTCAPYRMGADAAGQVPYDAVIIPDRPALAIKGMAENSRLLTFFVTHTQAGHRGRI